MLEDLPFGPNDVTAGAENEWMAAIRGPADSVDLPCTLRSSNYYKNLLRRAATGDAPPRLARALERFIEHHRDGIWENSWVVFPLHRLSSHARQIFADDLYADKRARTETRSDAGRFCVQRDGEECARVPVSYLLKLALGDAVATSPADTQAIAERLMRHFLNDNTSPETFSFHLCSDAAHTTVGNELAAETLRRFLLSHALTQYANSAFGLKETGQEALIYMAPQTPLRQQQLNALVADSFYRDLFMSPCLSGWDRGQEKHAYMILCHEVLSRSRLNTMAKLKECGMLARNLVTLPMVSNTSLANNGTHITLGSRNWTNRRAERLPGWDGADEKRAGDLVNKLVEHFLPLLVGTYSAAPGRFDFADFHPESVLGFLPHELDFTHLRMLWRRWKGKADLRRLGCTLTPFGPRPLDRAVARLFHLRGDWVPDQRLIDYLVAPLSTDECPALNGAVGNDRRLQKDLAEMGVFDTRMVWYALYRQRTYEGMGFCGFEGRTYSQFASLRDDFAAAVDLQRLITALAWQYVSQGTWTHADIPDTPEDESERRQIFFGAAIGLPTFFVRKRSGNRFLTSLLARAKRTRDSHRYAGRRRVYQQSYREALLEVLETDGAALVEALGLGDRITDLRERITPGSGRAVQDRLLKGILREAGVRHPLRTDAHTFTAAAERYYRGPLHRSFLREAYDLLESDHAALPETEPLPARHRLLSGVCSKTEWHMVIQALLKSIDRNSRNASAAP